MFHPTHVNRRRDLFDEALTLVARGVTIDVTAFPTTARTSGPRPRRSAAPSTPASTRRGVTVSSDAGGSLPSFDDAGRVSGLDTGRPAALAETLAELVAAGRPLAEVLPAFTTNPARQFRLPRKGTVEVGADADLVVLDDDHSPRDVMARGRWHVRDGVALVHGTFENGTGR